MNHNDIINTDDILLLESIRAGIPCRAMMSQIPDLRQNITRQIDMDLADLAEHKYPKGRFIWGEYGQGKTHFLKLMEQYVMDKGFAVSYYTINRDLGLNNIKSLFPVLAAQTMTARNKIPGLMNLLIQDSFSDNLIDELADIEKKISHPFPCYVLQAFLSFRDADEMNLLYNSLMGNSSYWANAKTICRKVLGAEFKKMPKFSAKEHGNCFFEFYPYLLKLLGFKGWVVLIDEIELIGKMGKVGRLNSYMALSYLLNWNNNSHLPVYTLVASAKTLQTEVFYSRKNDVQKIPEAAMERISSDAAYQMRAFFDIAARSNRNLLLNPVMKKEYMALFQAIMAIHKRAIPWINPDEENLAEKLEKIVKPERRPVRVSIRMFIELLDIYAITGQIVENIREQKLKEYDLTEEFQINTDNLSSDTGGFKEKSLEEMFDED